MRISLRAGLGYFLIVGLAAYLVFNAFVEEVKPGVKQAMEETMVDAANVLAELAAPELAAGTLAEGAFSDAVAAYLQRTPNARIFSLEKRSSDFRIYVTDARGTVLYDSTGQDTGKDFSRWRDVYRTLQGEYGARATRIDPKDERSLVLYVAAPVYGAAGDGPRKPMLGVLALGKPLGSVLPFAERAELRVRNAGLLLLGGALFIGAVFTLWLSRSIHKLRDFAREVAEDRRPDPPRLGRNELGELENAVHRMREKLDGRAYVEQYVQSLTHELKSPLAGLQAAAEVLSDPRVTEEERARFLAHIRTQTERLAGIVDRMLELSHVEGLRHLAKATPVDLGRLVASEIEAAHPRAEAAGVALQFTPKAVEVRGDEFLLRRAIANLLENAITFSPRGGTVGVEVRRGPEGAEIAVRDDGPGVPEYAGERIFERFYSLPRPGGGKGTGLGLPFVREIARLHGGEVRAGNRERGGFEAHLTVAER